MTIITLQQAIDERIRFLAEQNNIANKPEVNITFQIQIDAIRHVAQQLEQVEAIIKQRRNC